MVYYFKMSSFIQGLWYQVLKCRLNCNSNISSIKSLSKVPTLSVYTCYLLHLHCSLCTHILFSNFLYCKIILCYDINLGNGVVLHIPTLMKEIEANGSKKLHNMKDRIKISDRTHIGMQMFLKIYYVIMLKWDMLLHFFSFYNRFNFLGCCGGGEEEGQKLAQNEK